MRLGEPLRLYKHAARSAGWVVNAPLIRLDHLDHQPDYRAGGEKLAPQLALGGSKLSEEILVDSAENILLLRLLGANRDRGDLINEPAKSLRRDSSSRIIPRQFALELRIVLFDGIHRVIDELAYIWYLALCLYLRPARFW